MTTESLQTGKTMEFWNPGHFDFADSLNEEIWSQSPAVQQQVQPVNELTQSGAIGAQQAMLENDLMAERGPLPWVPDLVGKESQDQDGIVVFGSAYGGFINEYSNRRSGMPLCAYLAALDASSVQDFQQSFLKYVVMGDANYYTPILNLCSEAGSASRLLLMDLCRVSLVKRDERNGKRSDSSDSQDLKKDPAVFAKYAECEQPAEWLWRRFESGQAKFVLALGSTAEHGLLRLFTNHGLAITQGKVSFRPKHLAQGKWAFRYADPRRNLKYWLTHKTWWTVRGQVSDAERVWYVLPVYHPRRSEQYDPAYERTKTVFRLMLLSEELNSPVKENKIPQS